MSHDTPSSAPKNPLHEPPVVNTAAMSNAATKMRFLTCMVAAGILAIGLGQHFGVAEWWEKRQQAAAEQARVKEAEARTSEAQLVSDRRTAAEAKQALREAIRNAERAEKAIQDSLAEIDAWMKETKALQSNEAGRCIAANSELVSEFQAALDFQHTPREDILPLMESVRDFLNDWKDAQEKELPLYAPSSRSLGKLETYHGEAKKVLTEYQKANRELQTLVELAQKDAKPGDKTLAQALKDLKTAQNRESLAAKQKIQDDARADAARVEAGVKAKRIAAEAEIKRQADEQKIQEQIQLAAKEKLRKRAHSAEVQQYLGALFKNGYEQPVWNYDDYNVVPQRRALREGPVSFAAIKRAGWFNEDSTMMFSMLRFSDAQAKERGHLPIPGTIQSIIQRDPKTTKPILKIQELLRELGPTLVEEKLLAP